MSEFPAALLVLIGAATGLVGALLGLGGGVFLVPLLTLAVGVPIRVAIVASLLSVIATASASATVNLNRGLVNVRLGLVLEVATSLGGLGGSLLSSRLSQRQLFLVFGATLGVMGLLTLARSRKRNVIADLSVDPGLFGGRLREGETAYVYQLRRAPVGLAASLVAGAVSGVLGLGGGIVKVPALNTFCGIPIRVAAATSTFMIGVTAAAAAIPHVGRGDVELPLAAAVCLGALPGSLLGARLSDRVRARALKVIMSMVLLLVGVRMALEGL
ncbi:MAG TPA: sulfite exporter TauE/SafE family protein [Vicinamibacteria bacterium]